MDTTKMKNRIMRRVHAVYAARLLMRPETHAVGMALVVFYVAAHVSLADIAVNTLSASTSVVGLFNYVLDALMTTEVPVQLGALLFGAFAILAVRDICLLCVSGFALVHNRQATRF